MSVLYSGNVSRIFYNRYLHTEADTEVRDVSFSCVLCREDHTLYPAASEASGNDYSVKPTELFLDIETLYRLGIYPFDPDLCTVCISRVTERLGNRKIGIVKLNILADKSDIDLFVGTFNLIDHIAPFVKHRSLRFYSEFTANDR